MVNNRGMIRLSQFQKDSVEESHLPFVGDCHSLHLGEGIPVGVTQHDLGRSLDLHRL
jgi:hypothetical protein